MREHPCFLHAAERTAWGEKVRNFNFRNGFPLFKNATFVRQTNVAFLLEQGTGVEPASEAWEATIIADIRTLRDGKHYSTPF